MLSFILCNTKHTKNNNNNNKKQIPLSKKHQIFSNTWQGDRIKLTKRIGIPADVFAERGPTLKQLEKEQRDQRMIEQAPTVRPKDESKEDKKARKQAVKEMRRVC